MGIRWTELVASLTQQVIQRHRHDRLGLGLVLVALVIAGCAGAPTYADRLETHRGKLIAQGFVDPPTPTNFTVCLRHCRTMMNAQFTGQEWSRIEAAFSPPAVDAAEERERIAVAIGRMETFVIRQTDALPSGTGRFPVKLRTDNMDCVDEATNTTTYLTQLTRASLIQFHVIEGHAWRGRLFDGQFPHTATVILERESGKRFVVDSWFHDNGEPPEVLPLEQWSEGWEPEPKETRAPPESV